MANILKLAVILGVVGAAGASDAAPPSESPSLVASRPLEFTPASRLWTATHFLRSQRMSRGHEAAAGMLRDTALTATQIDELLMLLDRYHESFVVDTLRWRKGICERARAGSSDGDLRAAFSDREDEEQSTREGIGQAIEEALGRHVREELGRYSKTIALTGSSLSADAVARASGLSYRELVLNACAQSGGSR